MKLKTGGGVVKKTTCDIPLLTQPQGQAVNVIFVDLRYFYFP